MYYDDVCRQAAAALRCERARAGSGAQEWAERTRAADPDFALQRAVLRVDKRLLGLAEEAYDRDERSKGQALHARANAGGVVARFCAPQAQSSGQAGRAEKGDKAQAPRVASARAGHQLTLPCSLCNAVAGVDGQSCRGEGPPLRARR